MNQQELLDACNDNCGGKRLDFIEALISSLAESYRAVSQDLGNHEDETEKSLQEAVTKKSR